MTDLLFGPYHKAQFHSKVEFGIGSNTIIDRDLADKLAIKILNLLHEFEDVVYIENMKISSWKPEVK